MHKVEVKKVEVPKKMIVVHEQEFNKDDLLRQLGWSESTINLDSEETRVEDVRLDLPSVRRFSTTHIDVIEMSVGVQDPISPVSITRDVDDVFLDLPKVERPSMTFEEFLT